MGIKGRKQKHYSGDFKISAVEEVLVNHLGQRETARKYGVTHKMIQTWIHLYLEKGKEYLNRDVSKHKRTLISEMPPAEKSDRENRVKNQVPKQCSHSGSHKSERGLYLRILFT